MIGKSLPEYYFIRICIIALRLVAPLSIAYLALRPIRSLHLAFKHDILLQAYAGAEAVFFLLVYIPRKRMMQKMSPCSSS